MPALGDLFEGPLADPLLHVTAYPTDDLSIELVYVPFLAPYRVTVDEFDLDFQFGLLDIDMALRTPGSAAVLGVRPLDPRRDLLLHLPWPIYR